jgi:hypothetical protein
VQIGDKKYHVVLWQVEDNNLSFSLDGIRRNYEVFSDGTKVFVHSHIFGAFVIFKKPRFPEIEVGGASDRGYTSVMPGLMHSVFN